MLTSQLPLIDADSPVQRQAMYIGTADAPLFAFLHTDRTAVQRHCIAVICPPLGYEYVHSHRSVRHLADELARNGIPALRFDYHGVGDSPGSDLDPDRLQRWLQDIRSAVSEARALSGDAPVCLLGIRLGATLAAMIAAEIDVEWLTLWFPIASGRRYVREQRAVASSLETNQQDANAPMEPAGFLLTQQTQASLTEINLLKISPRAQGGTLLIQRDDLAEDNSLSDHLVAQDVPVESIICPGYAEMVAQPVNTKIPQSAIDATVQWLTKRSMSGKSLPDSITRPVKMHYEFTASDGKHASLTDRACRFGGNGYLFGIHTTSPTPKSGLPTIVMFNSGVVHRVGSNLLYTTLSRNLATLGFPVLRFDFEGIGDSVSRTNDPENRPYPDTALRDVETALEFLKAHFGTKQFIALGLCSGAYYSFLIGLSQKSDDIRELIMINPPNLNWTREISVPTDEFSKAAYYRESMRSGKSWKKLLRGQVNILSVGKVALHYFTTLVKSQTHSLLERFDPKSGSIVANQFLSLYARKRHVMVVMSSGDSGWDFLMNSARLVVNKGIKSGELTRKFIENSDHTFSSYDARLRLIGNMRSHLVRRYLPTAQAEINKEND